MTLAALLVAAALGSTSTTATQAPPNDRDTILKLAGEGRVVDAWRAWEALPRTPENLRIGVDVAVAARQLPRALDLYDALVAETGKPDRPALTQMALQAAAELSVPATDVDVRVNACGAALLLDKAHLVCRKALDAIAQGSEVDERALAVYMLANAGVRTSPGLMASLASSMSKAMRLQLAQRMTRLTNAERLALLQPLLDDPDIGTRYEAVLSATEIPGPEVTAALTNLEGGMLTGPLKTAVMLALARHGDKSKLDTVVEYLPYFSGFDKITAGRVLMAAKDERGTTLLKDMLKSPIDIERLQAVEALASVSPGPARRVLIQSLQSGSIAIRQSATIIAGSLELGTDRAVYRKLTDSLPPVRAAAVEAIAATFVIQDGRTRRPPAQ